jgi:PPM family protein phosphatase
MPLVGGLPFLLVLFALLALASGVLALASVRRRRRARRPEGPALVYPVPRRREAGAPEPPALWFDPLPDPLPAGPAGAPAALPPEPPPGAMVATVVTPAPAAPPVAAVWLAEAGGSRPPVAEEDAETVQLLPGWLEVLSGNEEGRQFRFIRMGGERVVEITLGRAEGAPYRHLRLTGATVSRMHARLRFQSRSWTVAALSETNPTRVNGRTLYPSDEPVAMGEGDTLQLGEVTLRYREEATESVRMRSAQVSVQGNRPSNEDAVLDTRLPNGSRLIAVADGMGGHRGGAVASRMALDVLHRELCAGQDLREAVRTANAEIHAAAQSDPGLRGMGTTLVALVCAASVYEIANVGDSRAYRIDANTIRQITLDHSFAAEALRNETLSPDQIARSPWRNALTRSLGTHAEVEVDSFGPFAAAAGPHAVLLCSDGLYRMLPEADLRETLLAAGGLEEAVRRFSGLAAEGDDNLSLAILALGEVFAAADDIDAARPSIVLPMPGPARFGTSAS